MENLINFFKNTFNKTRTPAVPLPPFLINCTTVKRPGLSPQDITSKAIEYCKAVDIPTEPNPDGSDNMNVQYTYAVVKAIVDAIKKDSVVYGVVPANSLIIQGVGASAGGPVTFVGHNLTDSLISAMIY